MTKPAKKKLTKAEQKANDTKLMTEAVTQPNALHAALYQGTVKGLVGDYDIDQGQLSKQLEQQSLAIAEGDTKQLTALLAGQAQSLNALFVKYGSLAGQNTDLKVVDTCAKLALRAQSQCRATAEAISAIQNPPHATFMTQNNISNGAPQQVNNGKHGGIERKKTDPITEALNEPRKTITHG